MKPKEQRRYIRRDYDLNQIRELFEIPEDEMIFDLCWDKERNSFVLRTLLDCNEKEGDI